MTLNVTIKPSVSAHILIGNPSEIKTLMEGSATSAPYHTDIVAIVQEAAQRSSGNVRAVKRALQRYAKAHDLFHGEWRRLDAKFPSKGTLVNLIDGAHGLMNDLDTIRKISADANSPVKITGNAQVDATLRQFVQTITNGAKTLKPSDVQHVSQQLKAYRDALIQFMKGVCAGKEKPSGEKITLTVQKSPLPNGLGTQPLTHAPIKTCNGCELHMNLQIV